MTAHELRRHLEHGHDIPTRGLAYGQMLTLHDHDHRPGVTHDHDHDDGPGSAVWNADCAEFGCDEERTSGS